MKRRELLSHLQQHGCVSVREGGGHSIWQNPTTGRKEAVPRHTEIKNLLLDLSARIDRCRFLRELRTNKLNEMRVRIAPFWGS
jgi:mRNA interferase HicA